MTGVKFKKYYLWFEEEESERAVDVLEEALLSEKIYWGLEEA